MIEYARLHRALNRPADAGATPVVVEGVASLDFPWFS